MFSDYDCGAIQFYKSNKEQELTNNNEEENNLKKETNEVGVNVVIEKTDNGTQLNVKDLYTRDKADNYDPVKLEAFLKKAYTLVNDALNLRNDELFESI